ncbi:MAG: LPS export ABC transporter permease LptG [Rhodothalassiaceae bacterium]
MTTPFRPLRRYFVPSRTFGRYLARQFLVRLLALVIGVVAILQMLDLLDQMDAILAAEGNGGAALWRYVLLRLPDLLSRFIPFSALLAVLLTLATLNQHSEIVVMKASGMSAHRILLPIGLVCAVVGVLHFVFDQKVVAPAVAELAYWQRFDYAADLPPPPDNLADIWLTEGRSVVLVKAVSRTGNRVVLDDVTLYERDAEGLLDAVTRAEFAWYTDGHWILYSVRRFDLATQSVSRSESEPWGLAVRPERFFSLSIVPEYVGFSALADAIAQREREGLPVSALKAALYQKLALPASTLIMPILAALAGFGVHRRGQLFARMAFGMGLGFAFFVADNFMLAMGKYGAAPPFLAAFGPLAVFLLIGLTVLFYTEE